MRKRSNLYRMPSFPGGRLLWRALAGGLLALFAHGVPAQNSDVLPLAQSQGDPAGAITTIEAAQAAHQHAVQEKARIEQEYVQEEHACSTLFFVNACRDRAKERRRAALEPVHRAQVEADTQMRRIRVAERDQALASKNDKAELEAVKKEQQAQQKTQENTRKHQQNEALQMQQDAHKDADQKVRQPHQQTESAAEMQKRADNVRAYEKKIKAAEAHQRDLAARKAEKAEKNRNRKMPPSTGPKPLEPAASGASK